MLRGVTRAVTGVAILLILATVAAAAEKNSDEKPWEKLNMTREKWEARRKRIRQDYLWRSVEFKKKWEKKYDKQNIRTQAEMQRDSDASMLEIPENYPEPLDFDVAETPPTIDFAIVQGLKPRYVPMTNEDVHGTWGGWGDVTKDAKGRFYFSLGDHIAYGANAHIIQYDPTTRTQKAILSTKKVCGWTDDQFADSKLHGDLDVDADGNIYMLTLNSPKPTEKEWRTEYRGSWMLKYNVNTGKAENLGIPVEGESWPTHSWDTGRDVFFAVGRKHMVMAYDTKTGKLLYGGMPEKDIHWCTRCVMLDPETGIFYTSDSSQEKIGNVFTPDPDQKYADHQICSYQRRNNRFTRLKSVTPKNPVLGLSSSIRAHTKRKTKEGAFWCMDGYGTLFKFFPKEDRVELVGVNWGKRGKYTSNMCLSPGERYLYYVPGADTNAWRYGTPVVQYDTKTHRKKVLAFIYPYYFEKYGYGAGGTYGVELSKKGDALFFYINGRFTDGPGRYGRPAIFHLQIPKSEREE